MRRSEMEFMRKNDWRPDDWDNYWQQDYRFEKKSATINGSSSPEELYSEYRQSFIDDVLVPLQVEHPALVAEHFAAFRADNISGLRTVLAGYFSSINLKPVNISNPLLEAYGMSFAASVESGNTGGESDDQLQQNSREILGYDFQTGPNIVFRNHEGTYTVFPVDGSDSVPAQYQGSPTDRREADSGQVVVKIDGPGNLVFTIHLLIYYQIVYQI